MIEEGDPALLAAALGDVARARTRIAAAGQDTRFSEQEIKERYEAVANAIATQHLEGLTVDAQTVLDLDKAARGELTVSDLIVRAHQRIAAGDFRR